MPRQVGTRDNGHTAESYGNPIGVQCEDLQRALVPRADSEPWTAHAAVRGLAVQVFGLWLARRVVLLAVRGVRRGHGWAEESGPGFDVT